MKTKFLKFVRENWAKSEYASAEWDAHEEVGTVTFNDGIDAYFEFSNGEFLQI